MKGKDKAERVRDISTRRDHTRRRWEKNCLRRKQIRKQLNVVVSLMKRRKRRRTHKKPRWYSGYDEVLSAEGSDVSDREDRKARGDEGPAVEVESEPEQSPTPDLPCYYPTLMGCRSSENYEWLNRIEGGYLRCGVPSEGQAYK